MNEDKTTKQTYVAPESTPVVFRPNADISANALDQGGNISSGGNALDYRVSGDPIKQGWSETQDDNGSQMGKENDGLVYDESWGLDWELDI